MKEDEGSGAPYGGYKTRDEVALYEQGCAVCVSGNNFIQAVLRREHQHCSNCDKGAI
jgi:hypothetical protein